MGGSLENLEWVPYNRYIPPLFKRQSRWDFLLVSLTSVLERSRMILSGELVGFSRSECFHRRLLRGTGLAASLLLAVGALAADVRGQEPAPASGKSAERLLGSVEQLSRGEQRERGAIVSAMLERQGWEVEPHSFQAGELAGTNLMVKVQDDAEQEAKDSKDRRWLVLGAHMDRVAKGRGAVDNGGGCAALMELCQRLKAEPLENVRVWAVYFDLEENGLLGSDAFARQLESKPTLYVNLDVFAYGDQVWLHSKDEADPIVEAAKKVDADHPFSFDHGVSYPPSDHLSFRKAGIEAASFSLLRPVDVEQLEGMFAGKSKERPEVLQLIHTEEDQPQKVDASKMAMGVDFVEATLRRWSELVLNAP